jgi:hypothetical protein
VIRAVLIVAATLLAPAAVLAAAPTITGVVVDGANGQAIAGVEIGVEYAGRSAAQAATSDATGAFALPLATLFPGAESRLGEVTLEVAAPGYGKVTEILSCGQDGQGCAEPVRVPLSRTAGSTTFDADEAHALDRLRSNEGRTVYLLPYDLKGGAGQAIDNTALQDALAIGINTVLADLQLPSDTPGIEPPPPVGLKALAAIQVERTDAERVRAIGERLNALAVVGGSGGATSHGGQAETRIDSQYHVIPSADAFSVGTVYVRDVVAGTPESAYEIADELSDRWALYTLLALSIQKFNRAREAGDAQGLAEVSAYLRAEKARWGAEDTGATRRLDRFIGLVDEELRRLPPAPAATGGQP